MKKQTDVLIVGGGFAGVSAAQVLSKRGVNAILVDAKDYFEVTFATLRNVADPKRIGNTPRKYYRDFVGGAFTQGRVTRMNDKEAWFENGNVIQFERAIIATGSRYPTFPIAKTHSAVDLHVRNQEILDEHRSLAAVKSILVMGGGVVGVEFAGEIASAFPDKKVTLAHSADSLLANMKPKAQAKALEQLTEQGVTVQFNRRYEKDGDSYRCTKSGETLRVDKVYACVGMVPNTEFLKAELPDVLEASGLIKVDTFMRVEGHENLYALGDCAALDHHKHGYVANVQGAMLANAIVKAQKGKRPKPYKTPPFAVIAVTGVDSGIAQMPFGVTTAQFFVNMKQKDMGISNMYKTYGCSPDALIKDALTP
ncbi:Nitric oxide reductase FlRd-NAD(+) reductase [BD1-7 clade bacterium]|uniref:Nitric oxide reductase FlRd-NAD(+) reductase n=1 Tax=BD1-7 clade bacterium TaxID=2029982 RepID=A0A5S9PL15_9GAMM|nr:Nitric oxide reductase FlRd-NAD(+) reductase [BD1-7 clade bacterium]